MFNTIERESSLERKNERKSHSQLFFTFYALLSLFRLWFHKKKKKRTYRSFIAISLLLFNSNEFHPKKSFQNEGKKKQNQQQKNQ